MKALLAEFLGTFVLVWAITATIAGSLALTGSFGALNLLAIAFTAGLVLCALAFTFGPISGGHFNPAVTIGLAAAGAFDRAKVLGYLAAQFLGGIAASLVVWTMAGPAQLGATTVGSFGLAAALLFEFIATGLFVIVILSVTNPKNHVGPPAPLAIGFFLLVAHLAGIPFSGASLNPARSLGPALFSGGAAMSQVWLYLLIPVLGAVAGAIIYKMALD